MSLPRSDCDTVPYHGSILGELYLSASPNYLHYCEQVMVFLAEFFFCLNWAPVAAVLLVSVWTTVVVADFIGLLLLVQYTVVPTRRATAEALQILMQHLLGDAFSPLVVGAVSH